MTDKAIASNFSFRMFDLYRRFVEILQLFPDYLQDFKTGSPKEEIRHNIIKQVFKYPQTNDKISQLSKYLSKNSKIIAAHAEDVPVNWKDAIKYTETCIKLVRRYLKKKGINVKDDMDSIEDIAIEIGECLHINPNEKQIEAIKEFLKYDLKNPKNSIASPAVKKLRNKTNKIIKPTDLVENAGIAEIKQNSLKMVIKRMSGDSSQMQTENSLCNESLSVEVESSNKEDSFMENQNQSYETSLENEHKKKSNDDVINDVQEQFKSYSQGEEVSSIQPDDSEDIKYLLSDDMKSYCPEDEYIIIEFNDQTRTPLLNAVEEQSEISSLSVIPDKNLSKKRKSSISLEDDPDCIKKLFLSDESLTVTQNNEYVTISYNNDNNKEQDYESVQESCLDIAYNACKNDDTSNSEIIVVDDDCYDDQLTPNEKFYTNKQIQNKPSNHTKVDVSDSHNELLQEDKKEEYIVKNETKYSDVLNMSYAKALELIETIMYFCESRNEVSLEEFLVLRRTRDKIHWQSLKEIHKEN